MTVTSTVPGIPSPSRLAGWISRRVGGEPAELADIQLIAGGRSNLTYRLTVSGPITLATVSLDGKLIGPWVDELRDLVAQLCRGGNLPRLQLEHLGFADAAGLDLLLRLRACGVDLVGVSSLIEGLMTSRADARILEAVASRDDCSDVG